MAEVGGMVHMAVRGPVAFCQRPPYEPWLEAQIDRQTSKGCRRGLAGGSAEVGGMNQWSGQVDSGGWSRK